MCTHLYAINLNSERILHSALHIHNHIFYDKNVTEGSVDENVMLVRLHIRKRNTSVISRDFFLMDLTFSVCFIFV